MDAEKALQINSRQVEVQVMGIWRSGVAMALAAIAPAVDTPLTS